MMKRLCIAIVVLTLFAVSASADEPHKFSPEQFQADLEAFITSEAGLTEVEAAKFFPLLREMQQRQRAVFDKTKSECSVKPDDAAGCKKVIQKRDLYEIELKKIQQQYHNKFFSVLPASKVYDVIKAEDKFHRRAFKRWSKK